MDAKPKWNPSQVEATNHKFVARLFLQFASRSSMYASKMMPDDISICFTNELKKSEKREKRRREAKRREEQKRTKACSGLS